jgi:hypothetical protein
LTLGTGSFTRMTLGRRNVALGNVAT